MTLRVAIFVGMFPAISETFIVRQMTGLLKLGHQLHIFSDLRNEPGAPRQPEIAQYKLLERTTFMDMPAETAPYEMPVRPLLGKTWPPGSSVPVWNLRRICQAVPKAVRCFVKHPALACRALKSSEYSFQAASLSALYRLAKCSQHPARFDILHAHFGSLGNSFRFTRELWQAPLIVSFHGFDFSTLPRKQGRHIYDRLFQVVDAVTVNSDYTRQQVEQLGCPPAKIHKLSVGLDPAEFPFRERTRHGNEPVRILTVARLVEIKGHEFVIRAIATLREQNLPVRYDIVGDGPLRKPLTDLIRKLGLENCVTIHGAQPGPVIQQFLADAHLFVLASVNVEGDQEGQGLVLQEAQACGLPVLATQHGALPEGLLPGQSGYVVPERDVDALAERLRFLVQHSESWPALGRTGRAYVEKHYNIHHLNAALVNLYRDVLHRFRTENSATSTPGN